jgi:hypothetical protein
LVVPKADQTVYCWAHHLAALMADRLAAQKVGHLVTPKVLPMVALMAVLWV